MGHPSNGRNGGRRPVCQSHVAAGRLGASGGWRLAAWLDLQWLGCRPRNSVVSQDLNLLDSHTVGTIVKTNRTVRNCPLPVFRKVCPRTWDALTPTTQSTVRHCQQCNQSVYLCVSDEETLDHAKAGHCIARELPDNSELPVMYLGQPRVQPVPTPEQDEALRRLHRERGIDDALKNVNATRACAECGFPFPSWRSRCRVCGQNAGPGPIGAATDANPET